MSTYIEEKQMKSKPVFGVRLSEIKGTSDPDFNEFSLTEDNDWALNAYKKLIGDSD